METRTSHNERDIRQLQFWKDCELIEEMKGLQVFTVQANKTMIKLTKDINSVNVSKVDINEYRVENVETQTKIKYLEDITSKQVDDTKTLEHYVERYVPLQIQTMIMENMKLILDTNQMDILQSEENKLELKMQK